MYSGLSTICFWEGPSFLTWEQGKSDRIDAILFRGSCALRVGDVHLKFDRLLEDCGASCGLVLCSKTGLWDDTVAQAGDLTTTTNKKKQL